MFVARNLSVLAYAQGFTLWHYRTECAVAETAAADYFSEASDLLAQGDMLLISAADGGRVVFANPTQGRMLMQGVA